MLAADFPHMRGQGEEENHPGPVTDSETQLHTQWVDQAHTHTPGDILDIVSHSHTRIYIGHSRTHTLEGI